MELPADHDPDHQQPYRKCRRTAAGPATGTSVAHGPPPITHVTQLPHPIDPDVRTALMKGGAGIVRRPGTPHPPRAPCPCQPTGWAGEGTGSRECTGGDPGATDVPAPGEQVSVHIFGMAVYGVEIVGSIRRRFFSTSSS